MVETGQEHDRICQIRRRVRPVSGGQGVAAFELILDGVPVWEGFRSRVLRRTLVETGMIRQIVQDEQPSRYKTGLDDIKTKVTR